MKLKFQSYNECIVDWTAHKFEMWHHGSVTLKWLDAKWLSYGLFAANNCITKKVVNQNFLSNNIYLCYNACATWGSIK